MTIAHLPRAALLLAAVTLLSALFTFACGGEMAPLAIPPHSPIAPTAEATRAPGRLQWDARTAGVDRLRGRLRVRHPRRAPGLCGPFRALGTTGDPVTPYDWSVALAAQLEPAVLVTANGNTHTSYLHDRCVGEVVDDYLTTLDAPKRDFECGY